MFLNEHPTLAQKQAFWHSVAYYNYIQKLLDGPRIAPDERMWSEGEHPFMDVLEYLRPQLIVMLGYRLWGSHRPAITERGPDVPGAKQEETYWFPIGGEPKAALAYGIRHPSSGFSGWEWHPHLMKAMVNACC